MRITKHDTDGEQFISHVCLLPRGGEPAYPTGTHSSALGNIVNNEQAVGGWAWCIKRMKWPPRPCVKTPSSCEGTRSCMSGLFESSSGVRHWNSLFRERREQHDPRIRKSVWPGALIRRNRGQALQVSPDDKIHITSRLNFRPYTPGRDILPKDKRKFSFPWHSRLSLHSKCERRVETLCTITEGQKIPVWSGKSLGGQGTSASKVHQDGSSPNTLGGDMRGVLTVSLWEWHNVT